MRIVLAFLIGCSAVPAAAQDFDPEMCDDDFATGVEETFPAHRSQNVSLGAPVRVRYSEGFFSDPVTGPDPQDAFTLVEKDTGAPVPGTISVIPSRDADTLVFVPDEALQPFVQYQGTAAESGGSFEFVFTTGDGFDRLPPEFSSQPQMKSFEVGQSCDAIDGGYRIEATFASAVDPDGPQGDVEYLLYLTRGPELEEPELRARARNLTPGETVMAFIIDPSEAVSPICIAVVAVDGAGRVTEGPTVCDDPIKGNFFEPCAASPGRAAGAIPWGAALALGALLFASRRRRRTAPPR